MRKGQRWLAGLMACLATVAQAKAAEPLADLYFGEALYHAEQGNFFEALARLDTEVLQHDALDEPQLDALYRHIGDARFALGDFELRYRMHHRAGRAIRAVLEAAVDDAVRNDAAYRLAKIHFQKSQFAEALDALKRIDGDVPTTIRDDIEFLRANVSLAAGEPEISIATLNALQKSREYSAYAAYNLGIAYLRAGDAVRGARQLDRAGTISVNDPGELAIRDKSNLVLGSLRLEQGRYDDAVQSLNRVRLDGPFANQALLSAGWASLSGENIERALVPWGILAGREVTDLATQEAMLALPYAYGQLNIHGRAATNYARALDVFGGEVDKLNESIDSIRDGRFLDALNREEIRQDREWVIRLRSLPETPETFYLMELLATHEFQSSLENYLDLADLRGKIVAWRNSFDAFDDMVDIRRGHYEPMLPGVDQQFRELDSRLRLRSEQYDTLVRRRDDLLTMPRPEFLATREERALMGQIDNLQQMLADDRSEAGDAMRRRADRLSGLIRFELSTDFHARLTRFDENLRLLGEVVEMARVQYQQYVRVRQAATHSYEGYDASMRGLRARAESALVSVDRLMARQGRALEMAAIDELVARRTRLQNYQDKARFALADSYDRATQLQAGLGEP